MLLFPLLAGCVFGLRDVPAQSEGPVSTAETRIDEISPRVGPPGGGSAVTITGAGFVGDVSVTFGGVPARDVTVTDSKTLVVTTPAVNQAVTVDVKVVSDNGADTAVAGYTFQYGSGGDSGGDTGGLGDADTDVDTDTDTDTRVSYAGMVAGVITLGYSDVKCPSCFGDTDGNGVSVVATARFHTPTDGSWLDWIPAEGTCESGISATPLATTFVDAGGSVVLSDGTNSITMTSATGADGVNYDATDLSSSVFTDAGMYDVVVPTGAEVAAFTQDSAMRAATKFTSLTPEPLVNTSTSDSFQLRLESSMGAQISWSPTVGTGFVLVTLRGWDGSSYTGSVTCRSSDSGSFMIPASALTGWSSGTRVSLEVTRYETGSFVLASNDATIEVISTAEIVGTATIQ